MLLALDTSTQYLSIALHDGAAPLAECTLRAGRQHSALLGPLIVETLARIQVSADDLSALAVSVGPGSYTGTRIGVALAKGMAAVSKLPLVPVTTLETVVAAQNERRLEKVLIATVAAGRERVIWAAYQQARGGWEEAHPPQINSWDELLASIEGCLCISGDISAGGLQKIRAAQAAGAQIETRSGAERLRRAGYLAEIAWRRLRDADAADAFPAAAVMPVYLKPPG